MEAQTLTVWRQADRYKLPRIAFVNKMDRHDASIEMCCKSIQKKLDVLPLLLQLPVIENSKFIGIIDLVSMEKLSWNESKNTIANKILSEKDGAVWEQAMKKRLELVDKLSDVNDKLAEKILALDSLEKVPLEDLVPAIRLTTLEQVCYNNYYFIVGIK